MERNFSIQKLTHNDIRNRLAADIVEAEMRIRFNKSIANELFNNFDMNNYSDKMKIDSTDDQNTQINAAIELSDDEEEKEQKNNDANIIED